MNEEPQSKHPTNQIEENDKNYYSSPNKSLNNNIPQLSTEDKGISQAFSQMLSNHPTQIPIAIDKNQLFETFVLFQNFMNMNQNPTQNNQSIQPNQFTISKSSEKSLTEERETIEAEISKEKNEPIPIEAISHKENSESKIQDNQCDSSRNNKSNSIPSSNTLPNYPKSALLSPNNNNNNAYDEIPIKPSNGNFIELFEKSLANDKPEEVDNSNLKQAVKKKIFKPANHPKKNVQVSKPVKTDKKYFYYTDILDENGKIPDDKKMTKTLRQEHSPPHHNPHHSSQLLKTEHGTTYNTNQIKMKDSDLNDDELNIKKTQKYFIII